MVVIGGRGNVEEPAGFGAGVETGKIGLSVAQVGEVAVLGVGIETSRGQVPVTVDAVMNRGVEPITPADDGAAGQDFDRRD